MRFYRRSGNTMIVETTPHNAAVVLDILIGSRRTGAESRPPGMTGKLQVAHSVFTLQLTTKILSSKAHSAELTIENFLGSGRRDRRKEKPNTPTNTTHTHLARSRPGVCLTKDDLLVFAPLTFIILNLKFPQIITCETCRADPFTLEGV
jgi:hypothetical protein